MQDPRPASGQPPQSTKLCAHFNTRGGCKRGRKCRFLHVSKQGEVMSSRTDQTFKHKLPRWLEREESLTTLGKVSVAKALKPC